MKNLITALFLSTIALNAFAAKPIELVDCENAGASLETILLGAENQRSFYNGNVGLLKYDLIEPAAASIGIAIVFNNPVETESGMILRKCVAINYLAGADLKNAKSSYNAKTGVTVVVPVRMPDVEGSGVGIPAKIQINIKSVNTGTMKEGHEVSAKML